jgi:hypothetical protein
MAERIQRCRTKGWKMPKGAIYVGRPTEWGNQFVVCDFDNKWFIGKLDANAGLPKKFTGSYATEHDALSEAVRIYAATMRESLKERARRILRGHDLACFCPLDQPCHADVLLELANA